MPSLSLTQSSTGTSTPYISGVTATFYEPTKNWLRYGIVSSVTYLGDPSYRIAHRAFYVPRVNTAATVSENYAARKGLISLREYTTGTDVALDSTVENFYREMGVSSISALAGSTVTASDSMAGSVTSTYSVGQIVSALITSLNVIILGRVSAIRYVNSSSSGSASSGYFRYYIKSWAEGPSGPIMRTYSTNQEYVALPNVPIGTLVALGRIPSRPMKNVVIKPDFVSGGELGKNYDLPENKVTFTATGGIAPYTWRVSTGTIMPGTSIAKISDYKAVITGTVTSTGTYQFTIEAADSDPTGTNIGTKQYIVAIESWTGEGLGGGTSGGGFDPSQQGGY